MLAGNESNITAIVSALNEAERIGAVLKVLTTYPGFLEVIVVDDGSSDNTGQIAASFDKVILLTNDKNRGKAFSMNRALKQARGDVIFFADADVLGLTHEVIRETLEPVLSARVDMFIAMRHRGFYSNKFIMGLVPLLGGERALRKHLWLSLPDFFKFRFRVETGLNFYARHFGKGLDFKVFPGLSQVIKERKYGFARGFWARVLMMRDIFVAYAGVVWIEFIKRKS